MIEVKYKALSIMQPWAWLVCMGYKDIENRNYPATPRRIYVHTSKTIDKVAYCRVPYTLLPIPEIAYSNLGAIIGEVDITGCVDKSDSPWFVGPYGFTLANPVLYDKPIPCKGRLGFFTPEILNPQGGN